MAEIWAAAAGIIGAGAAIYGANKQSKTAKETNAANREAVGQADQSAWVSYLLSRGLDAGPNTAVGEIPTNARAVNTRLPLWANISFNPQAQQGAGAGSAPPLSMVRRRQPAMAA